MRVRFNVLVERVRSSLFLVPMLAVVVAVALGFGLLALDRRIDTPAADLPIGFTSTVESARTLLGAIAGATISFAGVAFSVSLLILQLASSQYSPRVVHTLFRDPFNKRVLALVIGTFTYCIVVLRSVRSALDESGEPVIPNLSVAIAVLLGVAAILATVAFIDHNAHTIDVSEMLDRVHRDTVGQIRATWGSEGATPSGLAMPPPVIGEPRCTIRAHDSGWIQQVDIATILERIPAGSTALLHTTAGRYAIAGEPMLTISPPADVDELTQLVDATVVVGRTRTMQQDVTYGLRQTVDVAVKALSPGVNDPTTAQDAMYHATAILAELLQHEPPAAVFAEGDRTVVCPRPTHVDLVRLTFDEPRRAAATQPTVCVYLLGAIATLAESLAAQGRSAGVGELRRQARLIAEGCGRAELLPDDIAEVRDAHLRDFGASLP